MSSGETDVLVRGAVVGSCGPGEIGPWRPSPDLNPARLTISCACGPRSHAANALDASATAGSPAVTTYG
ncbi:hypothetical protein [Nonomuraea salmonea]|uniref:hypothetical protein n=1 Tax=Nonomuraea salmonea TaxID=46181 RepID=UPI002FEA2EEA